MEKTTTDPRLIRAVSDMLALEREVDDIRKKQHHVEFRTFIAEKNRKKRLAAFIFEKGLFAEFEKFCEKCDKSEINYPDFVIIHKFAEVLQDRGTDPEEDITHYLNYGHE